MSFQGIDLVIADLFYIGGGKDVDIRLEVDQPAFGKHIGADDKRIRLVPRGGKNDRIAGKGWDLVISTHVRHIVLFLIEIDNRNSDQDLRPAPFYGLARQFLLRKCPGRKCQEEEEEEQVSSILFKHFGEACAGEIMGSI